MNIPPIINLPQDTPPPPSRLLAQRIISKLIAEFHHRAQFHAETFKEFWDSAVSPDDLVAEMNNVLSDAGYPKRLSLDLFSESAQHLGRMAAAVGLPLDHFLHPSLYLPRRSILADDVTGNVYLAPPAIGYDAWGRPIPAPEPEPSPEPEPETEPEL